MTHERGSASAGPLSAYLTGLEPDVAAVLGVIVARAHELLPGLEEGTSYAMPALFYREKPLLAVIERSTHLAYYPYSGGVIPLFEQRLQGYSSTAGTLRFSVERPVPPDVIDGLILARRDEIETKLAR